MIRVLHWRIRPAAVAALAAAMFTASPVLSADKPPEQAAPPHQEKCSQNLPPLGLYGAANDLLEAALYAQWVLEDVVCKDPSNEEARKALTKLNLAITKAEGK